MKHLHLTIFLLALVLTACGSSDNKSQTDFDHVTVDKSVAIDNSQEAPQCRVHLDILQPVNATNEAGRRINEQLVKKIFDMEQLSPQAAADSFANQYTRDYRSNMAPLYREDRSDAMKRAWYEYHYTITTETQEPCDGIINYLITIDYYEGGAHGITQLLTMNFDAGTGELVTLADIFGADYEGPLCAKLLEALQDKTGCKDLEALHERGYLYSMDMFVPENYIVGDDEVTFVYNPYEIAPYSEGRIELKVKR